MNYDDPELRDRLAAEYVLGTLRSGARVRFERVLLANDRARADVERWERQLNTLALQLPERRPHPRVWRQIERRIRPAPAPKRRWAWPLAAAASTAAALILAAYVLLAPQPGAQAPDYVALIGAETDGPRWAIAANADLGFVSMRTLQPAGTTPDHDHELWLIPAQGDPISLGLLPDHGRARHSIPAKAAAAAANAKAIAISLEPPGGSPTGTPTGPVLYQGQLVPI